MESKRISVVILVACIGGFATEPVTGQIIWSMTKYYIHSGCTISGKDGRLYLGGYNPVGFIGELKYTRGGGNMTEEGTGKKLYTKVWCIDGLDRLFFKIDYAHIRRLPYAWLTGLKGKPRHCEVPLRKTERTHIIECL